jgi:hypothetical protein
MDHSILHRATIVGEPSDVVTARLGCGSRTTFLSCPKVDNVRDGHGIATRACLVFWSLICTTVVLDCTIVDAVKFHELNGPVSIAGFARRQYHHAMIA